MPLPSVDVDFDIGHIPVSPRWHGAVDVVLDRWWFETFGNARIISLNTGFWYKVNFWLYGSTESQPDPNGLLSFMVPQLQEAEDAGERVWIMGHIPMGGRDVFHDQSNYYDQVIQRYRRTIVGQFFGHTHADKFQLAYSNYSYQTKDTATSMSWIAPVLTPRSGNPAFKVYDVDPDTYEVMDMKVYSSDLRSPDIRKILHGLTCTALKISTALSSQAGLTLPQR
ncbi:hypothetical protein K435DRAFT_937701 [Dendrothele bispora CBS 962.96]|uniref:Calcineurin-like phosphoesterase domain-containing protein n=1 Tax=Dendrothele bispora (strain CBS 962.96) TaxID=1314807 RepID=A0A4S8MBQ2_DENBC|nr:hypothetical protein K435DRAFT_937701 [Dendrothele bispora CBS 962.96]